MQTHETFSIGELSTRTGVPIETLRIWERRHGALSPRRTSGRHRRYSVDDVERVRWLAARISAGQRISQAVDAMHAVGRAPQSVPGQMLADSLAAGALQADSNGVDRDLDRAFALLPLTEALRLVVFPALSELAARWIAGEQTIAAEHLLSEAVARRLSARLAASQTHEGRPLAIFCPTGERHFIGALTLAVLLVEAGSSVVYLGADTPVDAVSHLLAAGHIHAAVAVCTMPESRALIFDHLVHMRGSGAAWNVAGPAVQGANDVSRGDATVLHADFDCAAEQLRKR